jgi:uncharacterized Zn finger protein
VRSIRELTADLLDLFTDIPHTCPDCGKNFIDEDKLRMHQEIEEQGEFIVFRCNECGRIEQSLPALHSHAEKHRGFWKGVIDGGNASVLMEYTEKLKVTEYENLDPSNHYGGGQL